MFGIDLGIFLAGLCDLVGSRVKKKRKGCVCVAMLYDERYSFILLTPLL